MKGLIIACMTWRTLGQNTGGFYFGPTAVKTEGSCVDNKRQNIPEGLLFTPGPDECQVCTCLRTRPVLCRTVLCAPPKNCLSLRVGEACCQWICDEWETPPGSISDVGLRLVASAITAIFSLSLLFFLIYRLRQRRLRGRQNHLQAESYNSVVGQTDDCWVGDTQLETYGVDWRKPLDQQLNRPFPPSYDEAVSSLGPTPRFPAPPYNHPSSPNDNHHVIPYQVATLGRMVFPVGGVDSRGTLPAVLRRVRRPAASGDSRPAPSHINPLSSRHSLQISAQISDESAGLDDAAVGLTVGDGGGRGATNPWCSTLRHVESSHHEPSHNSSARPRLACEGSTSQSLRTTDQTPVILRWPPRDPDSQANNNESRARSLTGSRRSSPSSGEVGSGKTEHPSRSIPRSGENESCSGLVGTDIPGKRSPPSSVGIGSTSGPGGSQESPKLRNAGSPSISGSPKREMEFINERSSEPQMFSENEGVKTESIITQTTV